MEESVASISGDQVHMEVKLRLVGSSTVVVDKIDPQRFQSIVDDIRYRSARLHDVSGIVVT